VPFDDFPRRDCWNDEPAWCILTRRDSAKEVTMKHLLTIAMILTALILVGCSKEQTKEVGKTIDEAAEEAGAAVTDAAKEAGEAIGEAAEEAGEAVKDAAQEAGEAIDEAVEEAGDAIKEAPKEAEKEAEKVERQPKG
jgi:F0F1-type ATP synthase membrane subunit b/b'